MTWEAWYTLGVVALVTVALVRRWGPTDGVLFGAALLVGIPGIITPEQVFSGFVNSGTLTIAALFIVAAAMRETGALETIGVWTFGKAKTERVALARMALPVVTMSAFLNNTPIVAMLMPVVTGWCRKAKVSPSRLLMPLSFFAIIGGTCTLIGTSTHLAINGKMREYQLRFVDNATMADGLAPMGVFELAWIGLPFALLGSIFLLTVGRHLLPDRRDLLEIIGETPREYLADMQIQPGCRLIGLSVEDAGLRNLPGLFLIEIVRDERGIAPVPPNEFLREGDILTFTGVLSTMIDLERIPGLVPVADDNYESRAAARRGKYLSEAVISPRSVFIGKNVRDADFRAKYNAAVIAVHRGGEHLKGKRIGDIVLRAGDTLLLQTGPHFSRANRNDPDFYLVSDVEESGAVRHDKSLLCVVLMVLLIVLMTTGLVTVEIAAFTVAGLMVATRCISAGTARKSIDWETILTIGSAFALGEAVETTQAARGVADIFTAFLGDGSPYLYVLLLYVLTSLFSSLVSSKAAAILMFYIALETALGLGVSPRPFVMTVAFAAAATFSTPLGYPTNLMVYGPGGYRFSDFTRVGLPLDLAFGVVVVALVPLIWPF